MMNFNIYIKYLWKMQNKKTAGGTFLPAVLVSTGFPPARE
jgi:hypothetical protein